MAAARGSMGAELAYAGQTQDVSRERQYQMALQERRPCAVAVRERRIRWRGNRTAGSASRFAVFVLLCVILASVPSTYAFCSPNEYELKAAFLLNFASYVEWPSHVAADAGGTFVIGIFGDDPFGPLLDQTVAGKTINGRRVEIRRFSSIRDLRPCHVLFISSSEDGRTGRILNAIKDWHALTVGETEGFARNGGCIGFFLEDKKVRFEINPDEAHRNGLKISSKLLKLARVVKG